MRTVLTAAVAGVSGFVATFSLILISWWWRYDPDCEGDSCALEWAASVSAAILVGLLVGTVAAFATYMLLKSRSRKAPMG